MSAVLPMQEPLGIVDDFIEVSPESASRRRVAPWGVLGALGRGVASAVDWLFGLACLILFLSLLAALPIFQFLTMGYFLESSARVARRGRVRDGFIGVRRASRLGRTALGAWLCTLPTMLVDSFANSADLIDPGGRVARGVARRLVRRGGAVVRAHRAGVRSRRPAPLFPLAGRTRVLAHPAASRRGDLFLGPR